MVLYFFRHGQADWPGWKGPDEDRPLNFKGVEESRRMARLLGELDCELGVILTSPLPRAFQTAEIIAKELGVPFSENEVLCPGCSADKLRRVLKRREETEVMVVGHQPDFSAILKSYTGARAKVSKSGVARVDLDEEYLGKLVWLLPSKILKAQGFREKE